MAGIRDSDRKGIVEDLEGKDGKRSNRVREERVDRSGRGVKIRLLNVQFFTELKYLDLKKEFLIDDRDYNLVFLTETHQKVEKVDVGRGVLSFDSMREEKDKKVGGV